MSPVADRTLIPVPRLDADDLAWLAHEAAEHPDTPLRQALEAVTQVHELHQVGGCS